MPMHLTASIVSLSASLSFSLQEYVPLKDKNWFGTGGPARFYTEPTTLASFQDALKWAADLALPLFVLGQGANILISDEGFPGLVIRPFLKSIVLKKEVEATKEVLVEAQAGTTINELIEWCLAHSIIGLEEFSGIPGTVGGSVFINLHYFEFLLSDFLHEATIIDKVTGLVSVVSAEWFNFGYNKSSLQDNRYFLVSATFKLKKQAP